jgi:hypothetical protein
LIGLIFDWFSLANSLLHYTYLPRTVRIITRTACTAYVRMPHCAYLHAACTTYRVRTAYACMHYALRAVTRTYALRYVRVRVPRTAYALRTYVRVRVRMRMPRTYRAHTCMHTHTYMHAHTHTHTHACIHMQHIHMHTYHMHAYIHIHTIWEPRTHELSRHPVSWWSCGTPAR